jgi:NADPH:quinone reductase-like Zn-dependent oxidoreductase
MARSVDSNATSGRIVARRHGDPDVLEWKEVPLPLPGSGEVRIELEAASVNFTDTLVRRGLYPMARKLPVTPGYDFVGRIDALGEGVDKWKVGDRVADMVVTGGYSKHIICKASDPVRVPESVDPAEAATLVLSGVTAYQLIYRAASVRPGMTVLVHAAGGAVGRCMVELLQELAVNVYGTAREIHHEAMAEMGATPIDYTTTDWEAEASRLVPEGFHVVYDSVGEDGYRKSYRCLRRRGKLVAFGLTAKLKSGKANPMGDFLRLGFWRLIPNGRSVGFYFIRNKGGRKRRAYSEDLAVLFAMLERREIHPEVEERLPLTEAAEAHRRVEAGGLQGKLVLVNPDVSSL